MISVNLIPPYRQAAKWRRARAVRWAKGGSVYVALLLAACGVVRVAWNLRDPGLEPVLIQVQGKIDTLQGSIAAIQSQLDEAVLMLKANHTLIDNPDWSMLLRLLGTTMDQDIVLRQCRVETIRPDKPGGSQATPDDQTPPPASGFRLDIKGMGRTQAVVSEFTLRLEQTGLFNTVKLDDANLEPFLGDKAIAFRVQCTLRDKQDTGS